MSRHGYTDDCDNYWDLIKWRGQVASATRGKRGQAFLRELLAALDAMPEKELITDELIDKDGRCCTIGVLCKSRGIDVSKIDYEEPREVANAVGIAHQLVAEIEFENDEWYNVTNKVRWELMRKWVAKQIVVEPDELLPLDS